MAFSVFSSGLTMNRRIVLHGEVVLRESWYCSEWGRWLQMSFLQVLVLQKVILCFSAEILKDYRAFVDSADGYSYYYPSDWRDFDFRGHDSAFKDRYLQLQNVRLSFIPTNKTDIRDFGTMEEVVPDLVRHVYAAPNQTANIYDMQERTVDGKNYYTFEYELKSPNFSRTAFATIAIANGRYYTLIVGANERRWKRIRSKLKLVADSFRVFDI
ncbi:hypothetical protein Syun_004032 [Stephania yunnanensis]|uniref:PsbP C-terminal domain-containing protein n=1 Tax=Stephania yunnanensis TaxID=152371 RepID=A0AAP0L380_9MAGN